MSTRVRPGQTEKAATRIDRALRVHLSKRDFAAIRKAISGGFAPNRALKTALAEARAKVRRA